MYLKVPYSNQKEDITLSYATVQEIEMFLKSVIPDNILSLLKVDEDLNYPCVEFSKEATREDYVLVQRKLIDAGFEAY